MHLVVLKRNNIQLPDILPQSLVATVPVTLPSPSLSNTGSLSSPQSKGKEVKQKSLFVVANVVRNTNRVL